MSISSRNSTLAYRTEGSGPLVVLLHGLLMSGESWVENGLVNALSKNYCVAFPDLSGHGDSKAFTHPDSYTLENQSAAVIQIIDELGYKKAHIIGYSAGAWLATGLLKYHRNRLSSVVIGGWDIVKGLPEGPDGPLTYNVFMSYARSTAPEMTSWVTPDAETGLKAFFNSLSQQQDMEIRVKHSEVPVLFWVGADDFIYHDVKNWAIENKRPFLSSHGNHLVAMLQPEPAIFHEILSFIGTHNTD